MEIKKFGWASMICAAIAMGSGLTSCSDDDNTGNGNTEEPKVIYDGTTAVSEGILFNKGTELGSGDQEFVFTGDVTLEKGTYLLKGWVYIASGAKLRIPAGTIIKGDKQTKAALIVEPGGYVEMKGTKEAPIVMTSEEAPGNRKPGDWGGLIICGKAKNNEGTKQIEGGPRTTFGGDNDSDNSGIYQYIRVEFAGYPFKTDQEINGITFGSVGSGTTIDHLQVSYSNDDSYEWFGGSVNCKHLVALGTWDDDFDTDNGFSGKLQFLAALRNPKIGDKSASNGFESDNCADAATVEPYTSCVFANVSMFGPVLDPTNYTNEAGVNGSLTDARFQAAMHLRRNTQLRVFNSVFAGFPIGLIIENDKNSKTQTHATEGKLVVSNCVFAGMVKNYQDAQYWANGTQFDPSDNGAFADSYFNREGGKNIAYTAIDDLKLQGDPQNLTSFCMVPSQDSPLVSQSADWSHSLVSSGFEQVAYIGAFGPTETAANNWTTGWTNMDPQNTVY